MPTLLIQGQSRHLKHDQNHLDTYIGMMDFAGTGPKDTTCRQCSHWFSRNAGLSHPKPHRYSPYSGDVKELLPHRCDKYQETRTVLTGCIPHDTPSCRHFEWNDSPPEITKERPQKS